MEYSRLETRRVWSSAYSYNEIFKNMAMRNTGQPSTVRAGRIASFLVGVPWFTYEYFSFPGGRLTGRAVRRDDPRFLAGSSHGGASCG